MLMPPKTVTRREGGIYALERSLRRRGFTRVAGADEAGRGACAGPLVAAAAMLPDGKSGEIPGLADSKLLTPLARDRIYDEVVKRASAWSVIIIPAADVDRLGLQFCNLSALRRSLATLTLRPDYVLTDGFPVDGAGVPGLAVWKGDRVAACVAAASVLAKVTRDRIMVEMAEKFPEYGFEVHKGYTTPEHAAALREHGPCPEHRFSYANVSSAEAAGRALDGRVEPARGTVASAGAPRARAGGPVDADAASPEVVTVAAASPRVRADGNVGVASGDPAARRRRVGEDVGMEGVR
ncbi:ribonuclease HII [Hamadaea tsunoensis]|uniref:ribonuclease HII n=1 Tax=Hamadaea tsunoensis TaxID=53368 RepID=UPI000429742B|nr:ribonuclease HII [Hamadaea tsunoensis]